MAAYIFRRLLLMIPTLLGILTVSFLIMQFAPGGPIDQIIARIQGQNVDATARINGSVTASNPAAQAEQQSVNSRYVGAEGLDPEYIKELEHEFGFDKPLHVRYVEMLGNYVRFNFGDSYFSKRPVVALIRDKLPVSISLGLWTTLLVYLISIPLGIAKAVRDGSAFDAWTSGVIVVAYSIPAFLFAVVLLVVFAGGQYLSWFPLRNLISDNFDQLSLGGKIQDYFWHITLPIASMVIAGFATIAMLTKNSFLDEINKQYVLTARAKGLSERQVLYGHVFRNAMLIVIAGFPAALVSILFTSNLLIEQIFNLDGLGLLSFEAALNRDYPVLLGSLFIFSLIGLIANLLRDVTYTLVDPRIDFGRREV
jgi:microcin C transport system permease protein